MSSEVGRSLVLISLLACSRTNHSQTPAPPQKDRAVSIDAHVHIDRYYPPIGTPSDNLEALLSRYDRIALFGSYPNVLNDYWILDADQRRIVREDDAVLDAYRRNPGRIVPFLGGFTPGLSVDATDYLVYIDRMTDDYPDIAGLGEFGFGMTEVKGVRFKYPSLSDVGALQPMFDLAARKHLIVLMHFRTFDLRHEVDWEVIARNRGVTFIFPHVVQLYHQDPEFGVHIGRILQQHCNVYFDLSPMKAKSAGFWFKNGFDHMDRLGKSDGWLQGWTDLLLEFPDRFLFGSDVQPGEIPAGPAELTGPGGLLGTVFRPTPDAPAALQDVRLAAVEEALLGENFKRLVETQRFKDCSR